MKKILKRSSALLFVLVILLSQFPTFVSAATLPDSLYLQQATNVSCTRASNTMMLRARAYLSGNDNWSGISEDDLTNCGAWTAYGLLKSYSLNKAGMSFSVNQASVNGMSLASVRSLLNAHPEGVAMYWNKLPHCIFVTDIQGDTIYASDPGWGYSHARRPITSSYIGYRYGSQASILANVTSYWYVSGYNVPSSGNSPIGYIDTISSAGEGKIRITGWALDQDQPTTSLEVHVYVGGGAGEGEGHVLKANLTRNDIASAYPGTGSAHGFEAVIQTNKTGNQAVYAYAINVGGGGNALLKNSGSTVNIIPDTTKPTISNVKVSNVTSDGYTVTCNVSDNVGVTKVMMPTWTNANGQDDLVWHSATISGDTATLNVKIGNHKNEPGAYITHIYAYDAANNSSNVEVPTVTVPAIAGSKTATGALTDGWYIIGNSANSNYVLDVAGGNTEAGTNVQLYLSNKTDAQIWYIKNLGDGTYSICGRQSNRFINVENGGTADGTNLQIYGKDTPDDYEKWSVTANSDGTYTFVSKHNNLAMTLDQSKSVNGQNILCRSNEGDASQKWVLFPVDLTPPSITDVKVTEVSSSGYRVTCNVSDASGIKSVQFPTWTTANGQDDLIWHNATLSGDTATFYVKVSDHKYESGTYSTHIYAYDKAGNKSTAITSATVPAKVTNIQVSEVSVNGYRVTCDIASDSGVTAVKFPTWTEKNGQDDVVWHNATISDGKATFYVKVTDHKNEAGKYITHVYAYCADGKAIGIGNTSANVPADTEALKISDVTVSEVSASGYRVTCNVSATYGIKSVQFPTWTTANGQDDIVWHNATVSGNTATFYVKVSDHKDGFGEYNTHIYAYDNRNNKVSVVAPKVVVPTSNKAPIGCVDSVTSAGAGKIRIIGWALDTDQPTTSLDVHVFIGGGAGVGEGHVIKANITRNDVASAYPGVGSAHGFDAVISTDKMGEQAIYAYAINVGGGSSNTELSGSNKKVNIVDGIKPTISNVKVSNVTSAGYTVTCTVSDNVGVTKVMMPTWTDANGQDDLVWHSATISGNTATFNVKIGDHKNEPGAYITHIYAYDAADNKSNSSITNATVPALPGSKTATGDLADGWYLVGNSANPNYVLDAAGGKTEAGTNVQLHLTNKSDAQIWYIKNLGNGTYSICGKQSDRFINVENGGTADGTNLQIYGKDTPNDQEKWSITANSDGTYTFVAKCNNMAMTLDQSKTVNGQNILCRSNKGDASQKWVLFPVDATGPSITNVKVTEVSASGYRVTCNVSDASGIRSVQFPTWTTANGQDDIVWHDATVSGDTATFYVKVTDHKYESGTYSTHIYAYDNDGNKSAVVVPDVSVPADTTKPTITDVKVSNITADGYTVTCTVSDNVAVAQVQMPTWTSIYGQDDVVWHKATISGNTATFNVKASDHKYEAGEYITHIYVDDKAGNRASIPAPNTMVPANLNPKNDLTFRIATALDTSKGLDIAGASTASEANLQLWGYSGAANQKFTITDRGNGYYSIAAGHSGLVLDISGGSNANGTNVRQYTYNGTDAQLWKFEDAGDGYVYIVSKVGAYLDLTGGTAAEGTNIQIYSGNNSNAQKWKLSAVEKPVTAKGYAAGYSGGMAGTGSIRAYGVDVSEHQGAGFNFQNLKNAGYSFVILRCGFVTRKDNRFEENYAAAKAAGLDVGVYFYSYAENASEASYEADRCLSYIQGKKFEYPVYFDFEDPCAYSRNGDTAYSICRTFLDKIGGAGYLTGLYGYAGWLDPNYGAWVPTSSICGGKYECWMANYYDHTPTNVKSANYPSTYGMYQYTDKNYVNGVGPLDTNVVYKDYPTIVKTYHFNGY